MADPTPTPTPTPAPKTKTEAAPTTKASATDPVNLSGISQEVIDHLTEDVNDMIAFAAHNGLSIDTNVNALIKNNNIDDLINAHNLMCKNVAPATPKSIDYTREVRQRGKNKSLFNKIPLVRNLIILAVLFLIAYICIGLSEDVNNDSLDGGVLDGHGTKLFLNMTYLASISGLGVLFHLLKKVSTSVRKSTLVAEESISYIAQIILGIISGLLLSEILSPYVHATPKDANLLSKSLLALVGGFSSDAIFSILQAVIQRIKNIFLPANDQQ